MDQHVKLEYDESGPIPLERRRRHDHGVRFDGTVNLGHVLTFAAGMIAGFAAYNSMDKRVFALEEARTAQRVVDAQQDAIARERMGDINQSLGKIDSRLDKISDQLTVPKGAR